MSDTPRTDLMVTGNSDPGADEYEDLAAFTRQLERENADLRAKLEQEHDIREDRETTITLLAKALRVEAEPHQSFFDRLLEAAEAAQRDAERYRWLRDECGYYNRAPKDLWVGDGIYHSRVLSGEKLDARIDAAMQEGK